MFARSSMRRATILAVLAAMLTSVASPQLEAAKTSARAYWDANDPSALDFEPRCNLQLTGEIVGPDPAVGQIGDYERAKAALDVFRLDPRREVAPGDDRSSLHPVNGFYALCLSSEGGDLREALRIAQLFEGRWMMVVEEGHTCLSACAVLFMQAKRRDGIFSSLLNSSHPGRYMHYGAELGFHAPALIYPDGASTTVHKREAEQAYKEALASVEALMPNDWQMGDRLRMPDNLSDERKMLEYQTNMQLLARGHFRSEDEFPARLLVRMLTTPNSDMLKITTLGEAHEYGIGIFGLPVPKRLTDRMIMSACASIVHVRCSNAVPRQQCNYTFAAESGELAMPRLSDAEITAAERTGLRLAGLPAGTTGSVQASLHSRRGQQQKIDAMLTDWTVERTSVWPAATRQAGLHVEAATLRRKSSPLWALPCAVVTHWEKDSLVDVQLQTRNGLDRQWVEPSPDHAIPERLNSEFQRDILARTKFGSASVATADQRPQLRLADLGILAPAGARARIDAIRTSAETGARLRWYKVLPPSTPLAEIDPDVWSWYEQGEGAEGLIGRLATRIPPPQTRHGVDFELDLLSRHFSAKRLPSAADAAPTESEKDAAESFRLTGWTRKVHAAGLVLTSPQIGGKAGITIVFAPIEDPAERGGLEPWLNHRIDQWLAGSVLYKRQGLMQVGPVWIDGVSLPGDKTAGGVVLFFQAWKTPNGAQFMVEAVPEYVEHDHPFAVASKDLVGRLAVQAVGLSQSAIRALQEGGGGTLARPSAISANTVPPLAKAAPPTAQERAAADGFNITGWSRKAEARGLILSSPPVESKEGVTLVFAPTDNPSDKGSFEDWFKDRVERASAGMSIYKRQGLMRKGPIWIDAVSLPGVKSKGGTVVMFKAWKTRSGAQFVVQTLPEHVEHDNSYAIESDALISRLAVQAAELSQNAVRVMQEGR